MEIVIFYVYNRLSAFFYKRYNSYQLNMFFTTINILLFIKKQFDWKTFYLQSNCFFQLYTIHLIFLIETSSKVQLP